jgi:hypothetical protein
MGNLGGGPSLDDTAQCRWLMGKTPCRSRNWFQKESRVGWSPGS